MHRLIQLNVKFILQKKYQMVMLQNAFHYKIQYSSVIYNNYIINIIRII